MVINTNFFKQEIDNAISRSATERLNNHANISQIGHECPRKIWLDYRNVSTRNITPQQRRIFESGHQYEARIVQYLEKIPGVTIKEQQKVVKSGVLKGKADVIIEVGGEEIIVEIKTMNNNSFSQLKRLQDSHPDDFLKRYNRSYYFQILIYMYLLNLTKCLYIVVNKNTDELHLFTLDRIPAYIEYTVETVKQALEKKEMPQGVSQNPAFFVCKMCTHYKFCHGEQVAQPTCRSCTHFSLDNQTPACSYYKRPIPLDYQTKIQNKECPTFSLLAQLRKSKEMGDVEKQLKAHFGPSIQEVPHA